MSSSASIRAFALHGPTGPTGPAGGGEGGGTSGFSGYSGFSGKSGFSGYSGPQGTSGFSGYSGLQGTSGFSGYCGVSGFSGYSADSGFSGKSGFSGYSGSTGQSGFSGYSGPQGQSGFSGYSGLTGTSGFSGYSGSQGTTGTSGFSGYSSASGFSGYSGPQGTSGFSGYSGPQGTAGTSGFSGYSGQQGTSGFSGYSSASGFSGYSGLNGTSGFSGYSGTIGASGFSGYSGSQGQSGFSGYSGEQGTSGFSGYSGSQGDSGFSGYSGPIGQSGFSGYSGSQGASGFSGLLGPTGPTGGGGATNGMAIPLAATGGTPTDGSWSPGAISLTDSTLVTDAIDEINEILSLLVPSQPPNLSAYQSLSVTSVGSSPLKASGSAPDNTSGGTIPSSPNTAGNTVVVTNVSSRITSASPSTSTVNDYGSGTTGVLAVAVNGSTTGNALATFTSSSTPTSSTVGACVMTDRKDYPTGTPGFWRSFDVQAVMSGLSQGWNRVQIQHSLSGNTNEFYMLRDNVTSVPVMAGTITYAEVGTPTYAYSSSVPHYGDTTASLTVAGITMTNLAGETYYNGNPLTITGTNSIIASQAKTYANVGVTTPIARQTTTATTLSDQTVSINGTNIHNSGTLQGTLTNVNGSSSAANLLSTIILVKRGTTSRIDEMSIPVTGLGSSPNANNAVRRGGFSNTDQPALSGDASWTSSSSINTYDAVVAAGILSHNQINYSSGYLPVGPNLSSGRTGAQYFTCKFQRDSRSQFNIVVTGTYSNCWVALPGISDVTSSTQWWNMGLAFLGSGFPGDQNGGNGSLGCSTGGTMSGSSGTYTCTFGTKSSTDATNNDIIIRFKLTSGQSITALSFTN